MSSEPETIRLNKYLALQLGISRREADELIEKGAVAVNGQPAALGTRILATDSVTVQGKPVAGDTSYHYLAFHKPVGYVCSRKRQGDNPTIYELIPAKYHALKPVGRLDKDSSGIILLTNDGDFAYHMTHPSFRKTKVYEVQLDRPLEPLHHQMIVDFGVELDDGRSSFAVTKIDSPNPQSPTSIYQITMSEGRNRQIRRTFAALGYTVTKLHRTQFGTHMLGSLKTGEWRIEKP